MAQAPQQGEKLSATSKLTRPKPRPHDQGVVMMELFVAGIIGLICGYVYRGKREARKHGKK